MDATKEQQPSSGFVQNILPPRLEDAGLEDCALPPDLIKEAFFKAASEMKSRAASICMEEEDEEPGSCVQDPYSRKEEPPTDTAVGVWPEPNSPDRLVGVDAGEGVPGSCVVEKGGGVVDEGRDRVADVDLEAGENKKGGYLGDGVKKKGRGAAERRQ